MQMQAVNKPTSGVESRRRVTFIRRTDLPGVELRSVEALQDARGQALSSYSQGFEFLAPVTLEAEVWHRRGRVQACPGALLAVHPGELVLAQRLRRPGRYKALALDAEYFEAHIAWQSGTGERMLGSTPQMSASVRTHFEAVVKALCSCLPQAHARSRIQSFVAAVCEELACQAPPPRARGAQAELVRRRLASTTAGPVDLGQLARETGLSQFQVLRAFKRRFGLPPLGYQRHMKIGMAQLLLRRGQSPASVAAGLGFFDQSHLNRHFKRLVGVTPAEYARQV